VYESSNSGVSIGLKKRPSAGDLILETSHTIGSKIHDPVTLLASGAGLILPLGRYLFHEFVARPRSSRAPSMVPMDRKIVAIILIEKS
jgi:hypothetical protein